VAWAPRGNTAEDLLQEGWEAYDEGNLEEALKLWDDALKLDPELADAWYSRGHALGKVGRGPEAIEAFDRAIEIEPAMAGSWLFKGIVLKQLGKRDEAL